MATFTFTLAPVKKDGTAAVILKFNHKFFRKKINLGVAVTPAHWNAKTSSVNNKHPQYRQINQKLHEVTAAVNGVIVSHIADDIEGEDMIAEIESALFPEREEKQVIVNTVSEVAKRFTALKKPSTRLTYERTVKHLEAFTAKGQSNNLDEVNKAWLTSFENYLAESNPSPNARALHFRNLRAIFNYAIDEELTSNYPFRRFKIKTVKTDKRSVSVETLRQIFNYAIEDWQVVYRDMFKLSFMLIGINFADMLNLEKEAMREGRIVFNRHKTARLYSMKVEPEALAIIEKYAGEQHLLSIMDGRKDYLQYVRQTNNALRKIGDCERSGLGGKKTHHAICPDLSTYWARHTWATIASDLDIPKDTIAAALGHGGNTVTDIYIDYNRKKVDDANRKVLDWVLYGKDYRVPEVPVEVEKTKRGRPRKTA